MTFWALAIMKVFDICLLLLLTATASMSREKAVDTEEMMTVRAD